MPGPPWVVIPTYNEADNVEAITRAASEALPEARVLVVDDAMLMSRMMGDALRHGGHEVVAEAADGDEAIARYLEVRPDLTTLDITMPGTDGLAALRVILAIDPAARVVMCSALGQKPKVLEALTAGAKDFIVKPFQAERVATAVERALG